MQTFDVLILGAGAAGLMCAIEAGKRGRQVALLERADRAGKKILISGGGRCNFTNINSGPEHFLSANAHFAKSALAQYTPAGFIALVEKHGIPYHEKTLGQLFCDRSARDITEMLEAECRAAGVRIFLGSRIGEVSRTTEFVVRTETDTFRATALVVATGGLSIPKMGASGFGYELARQFGLKICPTRPALVPLVLDAKDRRDYCDLTGLSAEVVVATEHGTAVPRTKTRTQVSEGETWGTRHGSFDLIRSGDDVKVPALQNPKDGAPKIPVQERAARSVFDAGCKYSPHPGLRGRREFREKMLITHRGLSGPAILQISSYWSAGQAISIDLAPGRDVAAALRDGRARNMTAARSAFREFLPSRLAARWLELHEPRGWTNLDLAELERAAHAWVVEPAGTEGYEKAEVTAGGVDTDELSSKTMESRGVAGLFFIGEVVDVTGHLGGHNFQWAWASGAAAGRAV
jgi:predicted flavoprotein YhiN